MIPLTLSDAIDARDALAKALYGKLFDWLIQRINISLCKSKAKLSVGILDIFGEGTHRRMTCGDVTRLDMTWYETAACTTRRIACFTDARLVHVQVSKSSRTTHSNSSGKQSCADACLVTCLPVSCACGVSYVPCVVCRVSCVMCGPILMRDAVCMCACVHVSCHLRPCSINYANEKLQQHFNNHIFKIEQDVSHHMIVLVC